MVIIYHSKYNLCLRHILHDNFIFKIIDWVANFKTRKRGRIINFNVTRENELGSLKRHWANKSLPWLTSCSSEVIDIIAWCTEKS